MYTKDKEEIPGNSISEQIHELKNWVCFINSALTLNISPVDTSQVRGLWGNAMGLHSRLLPVDKFGKADDAHIFLKEPGSEKPSIF